MFELINSKNVRRISKKNPIILYSSAEGACGPSGLTVVFFDDGTAYGYNKWYLEDQKLIKDIAEYVPEFSRSGLENFYDNSLGLIKKHRLSQISQMEYINLGLGNFAYLKPPLYGQFRKYLQETKGHTFLMFRKYIQSLRYIDLFEMWDRIEEEGNVINNR